MSCTASTKSFGPTGISVPVVGQGTWHMGDDRRERAAEVAALRLGLDLGLTHIDTAEMYGRGGAEEVIAQVLRGRRRSDIFLVSKVLPENASRAGTIRAAEQSLRRLGTDYLDLYLLHWQGRHPIAETMEAMEKLIADGKIRLLGVSNFDVAELREAIAALGRERLACNQVLYNLAHRGIEWDLLPFCHQRGIPVMAYSPIEQGRLLDASALAEVAARHHVTPAQVALAWVLRHEDVIAIPKAASPAHVDENRAALDVHLSAQDIAHLNRAFPPPTSKVPLEML